MFVLHNTVTRAGVGGLFDGAAVLLHPFPFFIWEVVLGRDRSVLLTRLMVLGLENFGVAASVNIHDEVAGV